MAFTLGKKALDLCATGFLTVAVTSVVLSSSLHAQVGTRGSVDLKNNGLILQQGGSDLSQPPLPATAPQPAPAFGFPSSNVQPVQVQSVSPPTIATTNARGASINFDQTQSGSTFGVNAPPVIANGNSTGTITPISATSFEVRNFEGGIGDGLPIVDEAYATLDRGGVIETTSFGRPVNEIRTGTTIAADTVVISDGTVGNTGNGQAVSSNSVVSLAPTGNTNTRSFVGGVKPGIRVAIPRPKGNPPRRSTNVASTNTDTTTTKPATTSIFVQQPVQPTRQPKTTISRTPKAPSNFVSGGALGLDTTNTQPIQAPQVANTNPVAPATQNQPAKTDPLKIRILFSADSIELQEQVKPALGQLASQLKADPDMQIQLLSYASGADARRLSLTRALAVRANLIAQGIDSGRMIVKARGDKADGGNPDRLDIVEIN